MAIQAFTSVTDFDLNISVTDDVAIFKTNSPGFKFDPGASVFHDLTRFNNEVLKFWLRTTDVNDTFVQFKLGLDTDEAGYMIELDFTATNKWIRVIETLGALENYDYGDTLLEVDLRNRVGLVNNVFIPCRIEVEKSNLRFYFGGILVVSTPAFPIAGTEIGISNISLAAIVHISDLVYAYDQILYGNVNQNGAPSADGLVFLYNQATYELVNRTTCDQNGNYMIFIDDDPINANKYFLYGYVRSDHTTQPRGVSNITI